MVMVPGRGNIHAKVMFVIDMPSGYDEKKGQLLHPDSKVGAIFHKLLKETPFTKEDVYITALLKIYNSKGRKTKKDILFWTPELKVEIDTIKPTTIVAIGKTAIDAFDKTISVKADHGKARRIQWNEHDLLLIPWYSPAVVFKQWGLLNTLVQDARRLEREISSDGETKTKDYELVDEEETINRLLRFYGEVGFDVESTSPVRGKTFQSNEADICGASFSIAEGKGFYTSLDKKGEVNPGLAGILESHLWNKVVAGGKFEYKTLKRMGVTLYNFEDIQPAAALLNEDSVSLKILGRQILGDSPESIKEVWMDDDPPGGWDADEWRTTPAKRRMETSTWEQCKEMYERHFDYGCTDSDNTLQLWHELKERLEQLDLWDLYVNTEKPLITVLAEMEMKGIGFDKPLAEELFAELQSEVWAALYLATLTVRDIGLDIQNWNSSKQISDFLDYLDAPGEDARTKTGQRKTDEASLEVLKEWWPEFSEPFFRINKFTKLLGFVEKWLQLVNPDTGRIYPSINQSSSSSDNESSDIRNAPATGRLSASGPNVNQVPHHSDEVWGAKLRSVFTAEPGWVIMAGDAEQEEPRMVSIIAEDLELTEAFKNKTDIYRRATTALYPETFNNDPDSKWKIDYEHQRYNGKTFFLAWYYGAGAGTLIRNVDASLTLGSAQLAVANLSQAHPARENYLLAVEKECTDGGGWVVDIFGRKRFIPEILTGKFRWEGRRRHLNPAFNDGLRKAANFKVQGPCATVLKRAIVKIDRMIKQEGLQGYPIFPVHDEIVATCPVEEQHVLADIIKDAFQNPIVPLPISINVGPHWGKMEVLRV